MPDLPADALTLLRCPVCGGGLRQDEAGSVVCGGGHRVDPARQGQLNLLGGAGARGLRADTADMVAARVAVQEGGFFDAVTECLIAEAVGGDLPPGGLLDLGGGTGHYAARMLEALPAEPGQPRRAGVSIDLSTYAARRAARAHPRLLSVVADVWRELPVRDHSIAVMLCVFAPRNPAEIARTLVPGGTLFVVTPRQRHLHELVEALDLIAVDADKEDRLTKRLGDVELVAEHVLTRTCEVSPERAADLVLMGPNAFHVDAAAIRSRLARRPSTAGDGGLSVTLDARVGRYCARGR